MLQGKNTFSVETRQNAKAQPKVTQVTVIWDGAPEATAIALAERQLVVNLQSGFRKNGIPATHTVEMKNYATGSRVGMTAEQMKSVVLDEAMKDPAKRAALLKQLQEMK